MRTLLRASRPAAVLALLLTPLHVLWHVLIPASFFLHEGALVVVGLGMLGAFRWRRRRS